MDKNAILTWIDTNSKPFEEMALDLWMHPEIAYQEERSAKLQMDFLKERGFNVSQRDGLPTAFVAEWGSGSPVIGILGEYDALGGLSQNMCATISPVVPGAPGHGCGHNLLGTGGLFAACAVKEVFSAQGIKGTVRYYGCPGEEVLTGKGKMAKLGYFLNDGTEVSLSWHPYDSSNVTDAVMTAMVSAKFKFKGTAAHAGASPEAGRSALDAVELMNVGANYIREHMIAQDRLHYVITNGGAAPNIVPPLAEVWYFARAPHDRELASLWKRLVKVANGAAMMTETEVSIEVLGGCYNTLPNKTLNKVLDENLRSFAGKASYTEEEYKFAKELQETLPVDQLSAALAKLPPLEGEETVINSIPLPIYDTGRFVMGSTDVGDVANIMPTSMAWLASVPVGVPLHSWQSTAATGSTIGMKSLSVAAKMLAGAIYDMALDPGIIKAAKEEFAAVRAGR